MDQRSINWINYRYIQVDGYGRYGLAFIQALMRLGVKVYPRQIDTLHWPGWMQIASGFNPSLLTIQLLPSYELRPTGGRVWNYTMWEGTALERRWFDPLNNVASRVLVPHEFLIPVLKKGGVRMPIHVIPGGTCPIEFPVTPTSPFEQGDRPYTFLALGDRGQRKNWDAVWRCFFKAFGTSRDVRLIIKTRAGGLPHMWSSMWDERITFIREDYTTMNDLYQLADCFVFPSRGEGWGMPPREFAMTGKPVIATRWSGMEDGIDHWAIPLNKVSLVDATLPPLGKCQWANTDDDELVARMREVYEYPAEARQFGLRAAQWLRENQTWDHAAAKLNALMEQYG
jgi:glycosyltransferase involved in cell wall biosynthesis